jgi:hypothetical protein
MVTAGEAPGAMQWCPRKLLLCVVFCAYKATAGELPGGHAAMCVRKLSLRL